MSAWDIRWIRKYSYLFHDTNPVSLARHERRVWKCRLRVSWLTYDIQLCYCSVVSSIGGFGDARWVSKISSRGTKIPWDLSRRCYVLIMGTILPRDIWVIVRVWIWLKDTPDRLTFTTNVADFMGYCGRSDLPFVGNWTLTDGCGRGSATKNCRIGIRMKILFNLSA